MAVDLGICSTALVLIGGSPIASVSGSGAQETACRQLYPSVVSDALSGYRWRFATRQVVLELLDEVPLSVYSSAFQLPANYENVWAVRVEGSAIDFDVYENYIFANAYGNDELIADVSFRPDESYWPGYFRSLIELRMAAALAIPIAEDPDKAKLYENKAIRQYSLAKTLDAQNRTARKINMSGLRRLHRGHA